MNAKVTLSYFFAAILFASAIPRAHTELGKRLAGRDDVIADIRLMAERHVAGHKNMDTATALSVYEPYTQLLSQQEMAEVYESAFLEAKEREKPGVWEIFRPSSGWVVAAIIFVFAVLKSHLEKLGATAAQWLFDFVRRRFVGLRYIRNANLRCYCAGLVKQYEKLKVPFSRRELVLNDIFVPLRLADATRAVGDIDAHEAIRKYRRLIITGNPGAGKTVLLSHIALSFARRGRSEISDNAIPLVFPLHRVREAATELSLKQQLIDELTRCGMPGATDFVPEALENGTLMLLLDGLDEVTSEVRPQLVLAIKDLIKAHSKCRFIITCRSAVYGDELFGDVDEHLTISDFLDHQIMAFMQPWQEFMPVGQSVEHLIETLRDRPRIMAMARNPLQLTMICSLYAEEHEQFTLPHSRTEFYQRSTLLFLGRWHKERNRYSTAQKAAVLEHLGLYLHVAGGSATISADKRSAPLEEVLAEISSVLPRLNLNVEHDAQPILDEIVERSGLLLRIDSGERFQFAHLTVQEYYAAQGLAAAPDVLLTHYKNDPQHWREVMRLWCGLEHDCSDFVTQLFPIDPVMALECVADAQRIDDNVGSMVISHFQDHVESQIGASVNVREAYAAVASNPRPRGLEMFEFLCDRLELTQSDDLRRAIADTLAATNLSKAASVLFEARQRYDTLRPALISMGDLAVLALRPLVDDGNLAAVDDLFSVGTPNAAYALVSRLWDNREPVRDRAAWALASLLSKREVEARLASYPVGVQMALPLEYAWVWAPFAEATAPALPIITGKIAACLAACTEVPRFIPGSPMEVRLTSALTFLIRQRETRALTQPGAPGWTEVVQKRLVDALETEDDKTALEYKVNAALRGGSHRRQIEILWGIFLENLPRNQAIACLVRSLPTYLLSQLTTRCFGSEKQDLKAKWKTMHIPPPKKWWSWVVAPLALTALMGLLGPIVFDVTPLLLSRTVVWWEYGFVMVVVILLIVGCGLWVFPVVAFHRLVDDTDFLAQQPNWRSSVINALIFLFGPVLALFSFLIGFFLSLGEREGAATIQLFSACLTVLSAPILFTVSLAWFETGGWGWRAWMFVYISVMGALFGLMTWKSALEAKIRNPLRGIDFGRHLVEAQS